MKTALRLRHLILTGALAVPLALVACGNGDDTTGDTPTPDGGGGNDGSGGDGSVAHVDGSTDGGGGPDGDATTPIGDGGYADGSNLGKGDAQGTTTTTTVTIGGEVSGLAAGATLTLQDNAGDPLTLGADGAFTFATALATGTSYDVSVATNPATPAQTCNVTNGSGTTGTSAVINVQVLCTTSSFNLGGTVTGLSGTGLVLVDGLGHDLTVTGNGAFNFPMPVASGTTYTVGVLTQPSSPTQTCNVSGGSGTVGGGDVTGVVVNCAANTYTVGGSITGLSGTGLVLQNNGGDNLTVNTSKGQFAFPTPVSSGQMYDVTVLTPPASPTQSCEVTGGTGTIAASNVTSVAVACTTKTFTVGGKVTGLATGNSIVLTDNGGDSKTLTASGNFTFATSVASGASYAVAAKVSGATAQTCTVTGGSGKVVASNVSSVVVACSTESFTVGGTISGIPAGGTVTLLDNGADSLPLTTDGTFTFKTAVPSDTTYSVTLATSNTATCHVYAHTGTIAASIVTDVTVICGTNYYVDPVAGLDTNPGTSAAPWQTLTHAIANLPASGGTINLASGTYSTRETFPLIARSHQNIVGSSTQFNPSILSGTGYYQPTGGDLAQDTLPPILAVPPGVTDSGVYNCTFTSPAGNFTDNIDIDNASFTLGGDTFSNAIDIGIAVMNGGNLNLFDSAVQTAGTAWNVFVVDAASKVRARGNNFTGAPENDTIAVGYATDTSTSASLDLGTASDPGGNTITAASSGDGLAVAAPHTTALAAGNVWRANVQGASATGTYSAALVTGPADSVGGDNYYIAATSSIQF